jgi:hypothetical protein
LPFQLFDLEVHVAPVILGDVQPLNSFKQRCEVVQAGDRSVALVIQQGRALAQASPVDGPFDAPDWDAALIELKGEPLVGGGEDAAKRRRAPT